MGLQSQGLRPIAIIGTWLPIHSCWEIGIAKMDWSHEVAGMTAKMNVGTILPDQLGQRPKTQNTVLSSRCGRLPPPLSERRPPNPIDLLSIGQDKPEVTGKARIAKPLRAKSHKQGPWVVGQSENGRY